MNLAELAVVTARDSSFPLVTRITVARVSAEPNAILKSGPASQRLTEAACRPNPTGTGMTGS